VLAYLQHVVKRHNLRQYFQFQTELTEAQWDESECRWVVEVSTGQIFKPKYLVTALGLLSRQNLPNIPGIKDFEGEIHHTARWPEGLDLTGKKIGVIGNGSTGVQVIISVAKVAKQLVCFQRTPQYSVPSGDREVHPDYRRDVNERYSEIWDKAKNSMFAFGFEESKRPMSSVTEEEREKVFQEAWDMGGGFKFMFWTFCDISYDETANHHAADFIRRKIQSIVKDPEKARKLTPTDYYARRPLCDSGYYQTFNRDNVDLVDLKATPITKITPTGIKTGDGNVHELDIIIFATGFDAVDGNYTRVAIRGRDGANLKDHWSDAGPTSYLGISVPKFPNMFMILGPNGPFTNLPPTIETQVEFVSDLIQTAEKKASADVPSTNGHGHVNVETNGTRKNAATTIATVEASHEAENEWTELCDKLSANSLFRKTDSWIFGANVPGKKPAVMFYFGGLANYRKALKDVVDNGLKGFKPLA
jgi:cation diffusion facilitator CzcD-associated flavoprotein CzcO